MFDDYRIFKIFLFGRCIKIVIEFLIVSVDITDFAFDNMVDEGSTFPSGIFNEFVHFVLEMFSVKCEFSDEFAENLVDQADDCLAELVQGVMKRKFESFEEGVDEVVEGMDGRESG
jgi:hypothetical protein